MRVTPSARGLTLGLLLALGAPPATAAQRLPGGRGDQGAEAARLIVGTNNPSVASRLALSP